MSKIIMAQGAAPDTPSSGKGAIYIDTDGRLALRDDTGLVLPGGIVTSGNWTPALAGATTPGSHTYTVQYGRYVQIASLIMAHFDIQINSFDATMNGNALITGLPFNRTILSGTLQSAIIGRFSALASNITWIGGTVSSNQTSIVLFKTAAAAATITNMTHADFQASSRISGAVIYEGQV